MTFPVRSLTYPFRHVLSHATAVVQLPHCLACKPAFRTTPESTAPVPDTVFLRSSTVPSHEYCGAAHAPKALNVLVLPCCPDTHIALSHLYLVHLRIVLKMPTTSSSHHVESTPNKHSVCLRIVGGFCGDPCSSGQRSQRKLSALP